MNPTLAAEEEDFRQEVVEFLAAREQADAFFWHEGEHDAAVRRLYRELGEKGWLSLARQSALVEPCRVPMDAGAVSRLGESLSSWSAFVLQDVEAGVPVAREDQPVLLHVDVSGLGGE